MMQNTLYTNQSDKLLRHKVVMFLLRNDVGVSDLDEIIRRLKADKEVSIVNRSFIQITVTSSLEVVDKVNLYNIKTKKGNKK